MLCRSRKPFKPTNKQNKQKTHLEEDGRSGELLKFISIKFSQT